MKRVNFHLTEWQRTRLKVSAKATGRPVAELIRIAIEEYLLREGKRRAK